MKQTIMTILITIIIIIIVTMSIVDVIIIVIDITIDIIIKLSGNVRTLESIYVNICQMKSIYVPSPTGPLQTRRHQVELNCLAM